MEQPRALWPSRELAHFLLKVEVTGACEAVIRRPLAQRWNFQDRLFLHVRFVLWSRDAQTIFNPPDCIRNAATKRPGYSVLSRSN